MSGIKLFQMQGESVNEIKGSAAKIEKSLQYQIEMNLEHYLRAREIKETLK